LDVPGALYLPSGCPFHGRCPIRQLPLCADETPALKQSDNGSRVTCAHDSNCSLACLLGLRRNTPDWLGNWPQATERIADSATLVFRIWFLEFGF
jgi:hypothetical protein